MQSPIPRTLIGVGIIVVIAAAVGLYMWKPWVMVVTRGDGTTSTVGAILDSFKPKPELDTADYDARMNQLAHVVVATSTTSTSTTSTKRLWPVTDAPYPLLGALLPFNRIVAYYGNFYSKGMGVLGEYPEGEMIAKLKSEVAVWKAADPTTPVIPAIHYIAATAQEAAGEDGKYRLRMPDSQMDHAVELAKKVDGIVFLDVQVGLSNIQAETPTLEKYLAMPEVHLGVDPEFYMYGGHAPGRVIGTMDARDVNWTIEYLAKLVKQYNLPPKVLIIHRFTQDMLTNYQNIKPLPEVQVVIEMDGWGEPAKKVNTYSTVITPEPVQFTGFKLFYKNDLRSPSTRLMTPKEILNLTPSPSYIQYQ